MTITHQQREDMRAYLESQDVYCASPDFLDALIQLFQALEKGGNNDAARPSCVRGNHS